MNNTIQIYKYKNNIKIYNIINTNIQYNKYK